MVVEFGGMVSFDVFSGGIDLPEGVTPQQYAGSEEGKERIREAFAEYWDTTSIKFRDGSACIDMAAVVTEDGEEKDVEEFQGVDL